MKISCTKCGRKIDRGNDDEVFATIIVEHSLKNSVELDGRKHDVVFVCNECCEAFFESEYSPMSKYQKGD